MNRGALLPIFFIFTLALTLVHAQTPVRGPVAPKMAAVDPALLSGLRYRLVGPSRGLCGGYAPEPRVQLEVGAAAENPVDDRILKHHARDAAG